MNIHDILIRAAEKIEKEPDDYRFFSDFVPSAPCGSTACMLGWIGFYAGLSASHINMEVAKDVLGLRNTGEFYNRLTQLTGSHRYTTSAVAAAKAIRLYAEKYHGHEKPKPVAPDWNAMASKWTVGYDVKSQELVS